MQAAEPVSSAEKQQKENASRRRLKRKEKKSFSWRETPLESRGSSGVLSKRMLSRDRVASKE